MKKIKIREITRSEIELVHTSAHWEKVALIESELILSFPPSRRRVRSPSPSLTTVADAADIAVTLKYYEQLSLYINPNTTLCARLSAGGVVETALAVMDPASNIRNAFAIVRPPGHHAEPNEHMGFCFFNNVSVAARVVQQKFGKIRQVILDW